MEGGGLGVRQGFLIGQEIGYYSGCTQMWRYLDSKSQGGFLHPRAEKVVSALEQLLFSFPLKDPKVSLLCLFLFRFVISEKYNQSSQDERLQELMDSIRGRYKAAASMLNVTGSLGCYPFENDSDKQKEGFDF